VTVHQRQRLFRKVADIRGRLYRRSVTGNIHRPQVTHVDIIPEILRDVPES